MENQPISTALEHFHHIGATINRLEPGDAAGVEAALEVIARVAAETAPGLTVRIFAYDVSKADLQTTPVVSSGLKSVFNPREAAFAAEALERGTPMVSTVGDWRVCYPLLVGSERLGVLCVSSVNAASVTRQAELALGHYASLAGMALAVSRQSMLAQAEQGRKERELRRLRRAAMIISSRSNLKETLDAILEVALDITDAIYGVFRLVDRSGKNLVCMAITGIGLEKPAVETLPIDGHSIMATVAARREPVVVSDLREEPWRNIYYPLDHELEMRSEVAVPLIGASGRLEGVLNLESPQVAAFDKQDRYILQTLASQAVVAIQEARLLDTLQEISLLLPREPREVITQKLVERACDLLNLPFGVIWLLEKDQLVCSASTDPQLVGLRTSAEDGLAGKAIREAQPVTASPEMFQEQFNLPALPGNESPASALAVPLFASRDGIPLGVFSVRTAPADLRDFSQSDWDKKVLDILGHYAALAVQLDVQQEALRIAQNQRALTEAFAAVGDIAANLLHRLNNKIGTIPVRIEGIQIKSAAALQSEPYMARNLEAIQRSATEAMEIVRESLFHLHPVQLAPVSVVGSVRQAVASAQFPESLHVQLENLEELPPVQADSTRLAMVFHNLLENAADAMDGSGAIKITGSSEGDRVLLRVADDGPGIPPESHERIFEFNYSARARSHPGRLGFGLWWVKSLMARFGGSVAVESDGQHGAAFILSLPKAGEHMPEPPAVEQVP
jgi:signal transduction histidine kinase/putative methionine-R-sulfoxide reductase with GAF domain